MSSAPLRFAELLPPAIRRLNALAPLDVPATEALQSALGRTRRLEARTELTREGKSTGEPLLITDGWAARVRHLFDGRRQLISFALTGDLLGRCEFEGSLASSTIVALTPMQVCPLPDASLSPTLARAYAVSNALDEAHLMAQVTRIGRLSAHERLVDLLLEFYERLQTNGQAGEGRFRMPLTQELLADALGLTSVHLNRTVQLARRAGELTWTGREVRLTDPKALARSIGRMPVRVAG
ncbi:MAG TPA: Crp/Fnr family transcriptional regulator [Qipengyuania sp.]|nr:Crp/Fnr family transcriptional regulator [Qipengyuania sp.]